MLHESSHYISTSSQKKRPVLLGAAMSVIMHLVVGGAWALVVSGSTATPPHEDKVRAGDFVFFLVWVVVVGLTALSYGYEKDRRAAKMVSRLLVSLSFAPAPLARIRPRYTSLPNFRQ